MPLDRILFAAILALCVVVALIAFLPEAGSGSVAHPDHPTMRQGAAGVERGGVPGGQRALWAGWFFGVAVFLVFATLIAFGARHRIRDVGRWLALACIAVISAWTWLVMAYRDYLDDPAPALYLALPAPTAIMVYLFWPLTLVFVLIFVLGFHRWVLPPEDIADYERLLTAKRRREGEDVER